MTTWLWIIGITAVVWPLIVGIFLDHAHTQLTIEMATCKEDKDLSNSRANKFREEIAHLQAMTEQQDALITALWQKTFGFYHGEDRFDAPKLAEYLGVKPQWSAHNSDWAGPVHYLVRYQPYPWGTHARHLNFPE